MPLDSPNDDLKGEIRNFPDLQNVYTRLQQSQEQNRMLHQHNQVLHNCWQSEKLKYSELEAQMRKLMNLKDELEQHLNPTTEGITSTSDFSRSSNQEAL